MTFDPKNKSDKRQLYNVLRALSDLDPDKTPELLFDEGVGKPVARGIDYMNNVRKGEFSSTFAALIHRWLLKNHFSVAHQFAPDIFPETAEMRWRAILDERAIKGHLKIAPVKHGMGIVQRASAIASADLTLKLGQFFCLDLTSNRPGYVVAIQGLSDNWQAIRIGEDRGFVAQVDEGENLIPRTPAGQLDPLAENEASGVYEFALVRHRHNQLIIIRFAGKYCPVSRRFAPVLPHQRL